jgi:C4-type Zn-finger protein
MSSRFSKYPEELGFTVLAETKAIGSITRLEGLLLGVLEQLFG